MSRLNNPEFAMTSDAMDWDLYQPCGDCPFSKNGSPTHDGVALSIPDYLEAIGKSRLMHTCHMTDNRASCDGPRNFKGDQPKHCAGLIHLMITDDDCPAQLGFAQAIDRELIDYQKARESAQNSSAFKSLRKFVKHYTPAIWCMVNKWFDNPNVITMDSLFKSRSHDSGPETFPLDTVEKSQLVPCWKCGQPASYPDNHWPYLQGHETCEICHRGSFFIEELIEIVLEFDPELPDLYEEAVRCV